MKRAKNNDDAAFIELMAIIKGDLLKIAYVRLYNASNIDDAMQECLIQIYKNIRKLKNDEYFKTWAIKILINECNKINNKDDKYKELISEDLLDQADYIIEISDIGFLELIDSIPKKYGIVILLFYNHDYTTLEISNMLNENENTIKTRLKRGRDILKSMYEKELM